MENFEAFSQDSSEIKEIDWVKKQVKAELLDLQKDLQKESFYSIWDDGKVNYDMDTVKNYLTTIQHRNWSDLTSKNSSAWIMAVQIALEKRGIDVGKVDGIFGAGTKAAVKTFQKKNGIRADGLPGPQTIAELLKGTTETPANTTETPANTTETATETSEKMDLTKVNVDVLKKVYGGSIDKNWKGFQEKGKVIEIWGLKFKKWTEGMRGLGYKVKDDWSIMWFGQYVDGVLTGKWVEVWDDWDTYQWDFLKDLQTWKGKYARSGSITYEWGLKEGHLDGRGVTTHSDWKIFRGHREQWYLKWRGTSIYPNGEKLTINYENDNKWKWDYIFSTGEKIYWEWNWVDDERRECMRTMPDGKELKINMKDYGKDRIIEATSSENTIKIKVEKDYFVFQPESQKLAFPRGRKFDPFAIAHALNWAIKHVKDTLQKVDNYEFDQFEPSVFWDFVQIDRKWAALDIDLIDTRKYPGMNATKVSDWLNANAKTFGLLNAKNPEATES